MYIMIQIILLACLKCSIKLPASAELLLSTVNGIFTLSSFDKQDIFENLNLPAGLLDDDKLFSNLGGISFILVFILILLAIVLVLGVVVRNKNGVIFGLLTKIKKILFWNFIIRYMQVAFINLSYSALKDVKVANSNNERIISINILALLGVMVILFCYLLLRRPLYYLDM